MNARAERERVGPDPQARMRDIVHGRTLDEVFTGPATTSSWATD